LYVCLVGLFASQVESERIMAAALRVVQPMVQQNGRDHDYARKQWSGIHNAKHTPPLSFAQNTR
jgi:hypothetical protein